MTMPIAKTNFVGLLHWSGVLMEGHLSIMHIV